MKDNFFAHIFKKNIDNIAELFSLVYYYKEATDAVKTNDVL